MKKLFCLLLLVSVQTFAQSKITMKVFASSGRVLGENSLELPLKAASFLQVEADNVLCETGTLSAVSKASANPLHMTLSTDQKSTSFNGDVYWGRQTYLSLDDTYFCLIELK